MSTNWSRFGRFGLCLVGTIFTILSKVSSRLLGLTPAATSNQPRTVAYAYMSRFDHHHQHRRRRCRCRHLNIQIRKCTNSFRELLWHSFTELLIFLLPIISASKLKSRIRWNYFVKTKTNQNWKSHLAGLLTFLKLKSYVLNISALNCPLDV